MEDMSVNESCGAISPNGERCTKRPHGNKGHHIRGRRGGNWNGGMSGMPAAWPQPPSTRDPDDMSEGEWQAYGRFGY